MNFPTSRTLSDGRSSLISPISSRGAVEFHLHAMTKPMSATVTVEPPSRRQRAASKYWAKRWHSNSSEFAHSYNSALTEPAFVPKVQAIAVQHYRTPRTRLSCECSLKRISLIVRHDLDNAAPRRALATPEATVRDLHSDCLPTAKPLPAFSRAHKARPDSDSTLQYQQC